MVWAWGDPWPGSSGGTQSRDWGRYLKLFVQAAIAPGVNFRLGPSASAKLDAGNVLGPVAGTNLWTDLTCDVVDLEITHTASGTGVMAQADAATAQVTLVDPTRKYDPLNVDSPFQLNGVSRLVPNQPVRIFVEMVNPSTSAISTYYLFTGTSDSWGEDWTPHPTARRAQLIATDDIKVLQSLDFEEQTPAGNGDLVHQRIARILNFFGWTKATSLGTSAVALAATTLAQPAWEMIQRATDDEIGYTYVATNGTLVFLPRTTWRNDPGQNANYRFGCSLPGHWDVVVSADAAANTLDVRNRISAAIPNGTASVASSDSSIAKYGVQAYTRTDLGLKDKAAQDGWAAFVLQERAFPRANVKGFSIVPRFDEGCWPYVFEICRDLATATVQLFWQPVGATTPYSIRARVFGFQMDIDRRHWTVDFQIGMQATDVKVFRMGDSPFDKLDDGNRMG